MLALVSFKVIDWSRFSKSCLVQIKGDHVVSHGVNLDCCTILVSTIPDAHRYKPSSNFKVLLSQSSQDNSTRGDALYTDELRVNTIRNHQGVRGGYITISTVNI
ncbi:hypothetical protein D3C75_1208590 [compost metagenome]